MCGICISISLSLALLTSVSAVRSAPRSNSRPQVVVWPSHAAEWSAVNSPYHNRETKIGQGRDTQHRRREDTGAARGAHRGTGAGQGTVGQDKVRVA